MPTRDRPDDLARAAASVLDQDTGGVEFELVVVDDGATDAVAPALERLTADRRVRVVRTEGGVGPCVARNRGLAAAEGELVAFCDDDDAWLPGAGRTVLQYLDAHPEVVAASVWHVVHHAADGAEVVFRGPLHYGPVQLLWQNVVAVPFAVVRRSVLPFTVDFDPALPTGEDWDLWLRCSRAGAVRTVPFVGYRYTQHPGTRVTRSVAAQVTGRRNFVVKHGPEMSGACRMYHEAVLAGYEGGRRGTLRALAGAPGGRRRDAAVAGAVYALGYAAVRAGLRRHDPGLQARVMASLLSRGRT